MKHTKRIISMLLALTMLVGLLPVTAMAADRVITSIQDQPRFYKGAHNTATDYGVVNQLKSPDNSALEWGDVIYYRLNCSENSSGLTPSYLTPDAYTASYTPAANEPAAVLNPSDLEIDFFYTASSGNNAYAFIKLQLADTAPTGVTEDLQLKGTISVVPNDASYSALTLDLSSSALPLTVKAPAAPSDRVITSIEDQPRKNVGAHNTKTDYSVVNKINSPDNEAIEWGSDVYYRLNCSESTYGLSPDYFTPGNYTATYTPASGEPAAISNPGDLKIDFFYTSKSGSTAYAFIKLPLADTAPAGVTEDLQLKGTISVVPNDASYSALTLDLSNSGLPLTVKAPAISTVDTAIVSLATQAQAMNADNYISTLNKTECLSLEYGDVIYYAVRTAGSNYITDDQALTPANYELDYVPSSGEAFDAVKSVELAFDKNTATSSRWWIKITLIDEPANAPSELALDGSFTVKSTAASGLGINVSMAPKNGNYPLAVKSSAAAAVDTAIVSLATQAQAMNADNYISTLDKTSCQSLEYGDVIYYAVRTTGSNYITDDQALTPANYELDYVPSSGEAFDAVKSVELAFDKNTATSSRWWIKITLIDEPANAPSELALDGSFTVKSTAASGLGINVSMAPKNGNYPLAVKSSAAAAIDTKIDSLATQAQAMNADNYISTLNKTACQQLQYGDVIYYAVRTTGSNYITSSDGITPENYELDYVPSNGEAFDAVKSVELVFDKNTATTSRWWIKVTLIDKPANAPAKLDLNGSFTIKSTAASGLDVDVSMAPSSANYPIAVLGDAILPTEKIITHTSTAPQHIAEGESGIEQNGSSASSSSYPFGTDIYFIVRSASGSAGDIYDPDYIVPADYTVTCDSAQIVGTPELVLGTRENGDKRWYVKLTLTSDGSNGPVYVEGTLKIQHKNSSTPVTLDLTARNILITNAGDLEFNGFGDYFYSYSDAVDALRSISGSSTGDFPVNPGDAIYLAASLGGSSLTDFSDIADAGAYTIVHIPGESGYQFFTDLSLEYELAYYSSAYTSRWHLKAVCNEDSDGGEVADGTIEFRDAGGQTVYVIDLSNRGVPYFASEDDSILVSKVDTTKYVEVDGAVGRPGYDFPQVESSNIAYGETVYYMLMGEDSNGYFRPVTSSKAVEKIKIDPEWDQNGDKVEKVEIIKKRSIRDGYEGYCYFLAITAVEKTNWTTRYTVLGTITLEKDKKDYPIAAPNHEIEFDVDVTFGPEKVQNRVDVEDETDEDEFTRLDEVPRRYEFGNGKLQEDKEDVFYFFAMGDDSYFTVNTVNQPNILLGNDVVYNEEIGARYPDAQLFFFNGTGKEFNHYGEMTLAAEPGTYLYERVGNMLLKINGLEYDEHEGAFKFRTRKIGSYVFSDRELDFDRYNVSRIAPWAQGLNEDNSLSTLSGRQYKGAYVEYGTKIFFALRNGENKDVDKTITERMAIDPANFSFAFESDDPNAPSLKYADLVFHENHIKSSDTRTNRWYVAMQFAEVPDPGVPRTVTGDFVMLYKGEELIRMTMGKTTESDSTYDGDYTITLHGGRPVRDDWTPADYVAPVLRTDAEISALPVSDNMMESESDGDTASSASDAAASSSAEDSETASEAAPSESGTDAE